MESSENRKELWREYMEWKCGGPAVEVDGPQWYQMGKPYVPDLDNEKMPPPIDWAKMVDNSILSDFEKWLKNRT